jgi:hypothetical protein
LRRSDSQVNVANLLDESLGGSRDGFRRGRHGGPVVGLDRNPVCSLNTPSYLRFVIADETMDDASPLGYGGLG